MTQSHDITIRDAHVNVAGSIISGNINIQMPAADVNLQELEQRLIAHRKQINVCVKMMELESEKGYNQEDSQIKVIALNAVTSKAYIDFIIPEILNRGGFAEYTKHDIDIDVLLTQAFQRGRKKYSNKRHRRTVLYLVCIIISLYFSFITHRFFSNTGLYQNGVLAANTGKSNRSVENSTSQVETIVPEERMTVTSEALNIRDKPTVDAKLIYKLFKDDVVIVFPGIAENNGWIYISFVNKKEEIIQGWVRKIYIKPEK